MAMTTQTYLESPSSGGWWGRHAIETNRADFWQIGPLKLWVQHLAHEWKIFWTHGTDALEPSLRSVPGSRGEAPPEGAKEATCVFASVGSSEDLLFAPALPDRPVIARPRSPLHVLPGEKAEIFVLTPLSVRLELARSSKLLQEIPTYRLSDSWFGPMSSMGELCYAGAASAVLDLKDVPLRYHCAVTSITIRNAGDDALVLERIKVPMPRLSLFFSPRTGFWTDSFTLERRHDSEMAEIRLDRQPPPQASPNQFVAGPRMSGTEPNAVIRAFSRFFKERSHP